MATITTLVAPVLERGLLKAQRAQLMAPVYRALTSAAAFKALYRPLNRPRRHFWELTGHGLLAEPGRLRCVPSLVSRDATSAAD